MLYIVESICIIPTLDFFSLVLADYGLDMIPEAVESSTLIGRHEDSGVLPN
jgi:hypothetical protein